MYCQRFGAKSCNSYVGSGSSEHCFDGDSRDDGDNHVDADTPEDTNAGGRIIDEARFAARMMSMHECR